MERSRLKSYCEADLFRYGGARSKFPFFKALFTTDPGFRYTYILRHAAVFSKYTPRGFLFRLLYRHYSYKYGFQIPPDVKIGKGLFIGHWGTIIINKSAEIGDYCNMTCNTVIGQTNRGPLKGCPKIGNKVWIGTGSVIVGKIVIGDNVLICPNALVNFNVPSNSIVKGNPAKSVQDIHATDGYVRYIIDEPSGDED